MSGAFIALAALLALAAAAAIAVPLVWRRGAVAAQPVQASPASQSQPETPVVAPAPWVAATASLLLVVGAALLYARWSSWTWPAVDPAAATTPAQMVSQLSRRLESQPEDVAGWLMLGRSYAALGQFPLAVRAFQRADRLEGGRNVEALTGWAEALTLGNDAELDGRAGKLFDKALELQPDAPKALFFGAIAAQRRGELPLALSRFEALLATSPPDNVRPLLEQQVAALKSAMTGAPVASAATTGPAVSGAAGANSSAGAASDTGAVVRVRVRVAPALARTIPADALLFVFVRIPGQPGPPVAVKRLSATLPQRVELGAADAMMGGRGFGVGDEVDVTARIALGGQPTATKGDPVGQLRYAVGRDGEKDLVIDQLTP